MKASLLLFLAAFPAFAQYNNFLDDHLNNTIGQSTWWTTNPSVSEGPSGLTSSSSGSLIYSGNGSYLSGQQEYEVRGTFNIPLTLTSTANSPTYVLYLEASSNALYPSTAGTYYALVLNNFAWSTVGGQQVCNASMAMYKSSGGTLTQLSSTASFACAQNTVVRFIYGASHQLVAWVGLPVAGQTYSAFATDSTLTGMPGISAANTTASGSSVSEVQLYTPDTVAPSAIDPHTVGTSTFSNEIDLQWQAPPDDTGGSGVAFYLIQRNGMTHYWDAASAAFADTSSLSPSTSYTYSILAVDYFFNLSSTPVTVVTPPAGYIPPREVGIRRLGAYWGGAGEQIDMRSGNLSYTMPVFTAMGRGGKNATFSLSYNSQNWRQDYSSSAQQVWQLGRDVGYGYGWKLQVGSLLPVWGTSYSIDHYVFMDSTGAEYRLDQQATPGIWTSVEGIYLQYNAAQQRLYFPDGSFWYFGCTSAGTEDDAGTMYPTLLEDTNGNQITVHYASGVGASWLNSSGRIATVDDVRRLDSFTLNYDTSTPPHLTSINDNVTGAASYTFGYGSATLSRHSLPIRLGLELGRCCSR